MSSRKLMSAAAKMSEHRCNKHLGKMQQARWTGNLLPWQKRRSLDHYPGSNMNELEGCSPKQFEENSWCYDFRDWAQSEILSSLPESLQHACHPLVVIRTSVGSKVTCNRSWAAHAPIKARDHCLFLKVGACSGLAEPLQSLQHVLQSLYGMKIMSTKLATILRLSWWRWSLGKYVISCVLLKRNRFCCCWHAVNSCRCRQRGTVGMFKDWGLWVRV